MLTFGPFRLDVPNVCVRRGTATLPMSPKACAVLRLLVDQPGELVSKETLLETVWPDVAVSDAVLTVCISELRRLLGDSARAPRFIETVHRRGYRFIAPVTQTGDPKRAAGGPRQPIPASPLLVGRDAKLRRLHDCLAKAQHGQRQVVLVSGEPGIGKTTLLDAFAAQAAATPLWTARGQCIAHYGSGEAYLPVLDALGQLCREMDDEQLLSLLKRYAPTWLAHLPSLLTTVEFEALQHHVQGATPERMLREMAEALEALTAVQPLVLVLEDLHWSDMATLDLLAWLARRRQPARLMLVGTYRPVDIIVRQHPLRVVIQELALHQLCAELPLELLTEAEVEQYLSARYSERVMPEPLSALLHQHTEGNPLFLVTLIEALERQGIAWDALVDVEEALRDIPQSLRGLVEQQLAECRDQERQVLEAASVAGFTFAAAVLLSAGVEETVETVEQCCATLASRSQFLQASGLEVWPDGTLSQTFGFRHVLYREVLYNDVAPARRVRLHRAIGARLESGYAGQTELMAGALAEHFGCGRDDAKAVAYHQLAAETALNRRAPREAIGHLRQGLAALERLPASPVQTQQELHLHTLLGAALIATHGYGAQDVERTYARAWDLCQHLEDDPSLGRVFCGLWSFYTARADLPRATALATQLFALALRQGEPALQLAAHNIEGQTRLYLGEPAAARVYVNHALKVYDAQAHRSLIDRYGEDPGVVCRGYGARVHWLLGAPDHARRLIDEGLQLAHDLAHPASIAQQLWAGALRYQWCGDVSHVQALTHRLLGLDPDEVSPMWLAGGAILQAWGLVQQGRPTAGMAQIRQGLDDWRATGMALFRPYYLALLAEALQENGQAAEGLEVLGEALALVEATEERWWEAELYRLKGELTLQQGVGARPQLFVSTCRSPTSDPHAEAEGCLSKALDVARHQHAKSLELRAAMSLARLWRKQGKRQEAYDLLALIYGWFTEGFDTADLQEAKALLQELA